MRRIIAVAVLLAVVALPAAACGDDPGPAAGRPGVGDSLTVAGNSSTLDVTLRETRRLPAESAGGVETRPALFGVKLTIRNLTGAFYDDAISLCAALTDAGGRTHDVAWRVVDPMDDGFRDVLEGVRIPSGGTRSGWVYFALAPDEQPATLRYTAEAGFGPETGVWALE